MTRREPHRTPGRVAFAVWLAIVGSLLVAAAVCCRNMSAPGLYYDELIFVNAALGGSTDHFVSLRLAGVPVLIMPYLGALKAWLYWPIFEFLPVDAWSVRLPAILIGLSGTALSVRALWIWFGPRPALVGLALLAFDPTVLTHSKLDWGPNALMFFLRGAMVLCIAQWSVAHARKWAWLALGVMAAGLLDKLNFVWLSLPALLAGALTFRSTYLLWWRTSRLEAGAFLVAALGLNAAAIALGLHLRQEVDAPSWIERLSTSAHLLNLALFGGGALAFVSGSGLRFRGPEAWSVAAVIAMAFIGGVQMARFRSPGLRPLMFLFLFALGAVGAFAVTKQATGPHHSAIISGAWQLVCAAPIAALLERSSSLRRDTARIALMTLLVLTCSATMLWTSVRATSTMAVEIRNPSWDPANWAAGQFAAERPGDRFVFADWGMAMQALAATHGDGARLADHWPSFQSMESSATIIDAELSRGPFFLVTRVPPSETMPGSYANARGGIERARCVAESIQVLHDLGGKPIIEIFRVRRRESEQTPF